MNRVNRRDIAKNGLWGMGILAMPQFLASCIHQDSTLAMNSNGLAARELFQKFGVDEAVLKRVMGELVIRGASDADLYFEHRKTNSLVHQDGIVNEARSIIDQGVGLRVVIGDKVGFAFTEDLSLEAMLKAAQSAAAIAKGKSAPPPSTFTMKSLEKNFYKMDLPWSELGVFRKLETLEKAVNYARKADPSITEVAASWYDSESTVMIVTMRGEIFSDIRPMGVIALITNAKKNGVTQTNFDSLAGRTDINYFTDARIKTLAETTARDTLILFDAVQPSAGEMPVVLAAGASGILLHEAVGHGLEADFNRKNESIYSSMMGQKVAADFVTVVDDGTLEHERGSINIDDEGNPGKKTVLIEKGRLVSYMHDSISAKQYGVEPTGSGRRESFRHVPMPRMRCTSMDNGPHTREEIIASVKKGIIAENFRNGQVQIAGGDYTFYIKNGWMIENGKITRPIKDTNIIGNGPESLKRITMAANDSTLAKGGWTCGKNGQSVPVSQGLPTVLVSSLTVGGSHA